MTTNRTLSIQLHGDKLYYTQLSFPKFHIDALVDTGAFSSALPLKSFKLIQKEAPEYISTSCKSFPKFVKLANGENVSFLYNIEIKFYIAGRCFTEQFLVLKEMNSPLLACLSSKRMILSYILTKKYSIVNHF